MSSRREPQRSGLPGATAARSILLLAAAALLPCCKTTPGNQPTLSEVTVRVSVAASGAEANPGILTLPTGIGSQNPSISSDGRFVAFDSSSTNLTPAFVNSHCNIFVKDRQSGDVLDVTNVVQGEFGPFIDDCTHPVISGNGQVVAFLSKGVYVLSLGGSTNVNVWVYNIPAQTFSCGTLVSTNLPNADCSNLALSDDGRFLVFVTAATNIISSAVSAPATYYANPSAATQVYVTDLQAPTSVPAIKLMSPSRTSATTGCTGGASGASISADGSTVAFTSAATNLIVSPPASGAYTSTVTGTSVKLVSKGLNPNTNVVEAGLGLYFGTALSSDGSLVAFSAANVTNWEPGISLGIYRFDSALGRAVNVAPDVTSKFGFILAPDTFGLSGDGQILVYMSGEVTTRNLLTGSVESSSVDISGAGANLQCFSPTVSRDGRWAAWYTLATNLVASDTNGSNDIFVRGPLR